MYDADGSQRRNALRVKSQGRQDHMGLITVLFDNAIDVMKRRETAYVR
jgi:hypothetical protein